LCQHVNKHRQALFPFVDDAKVDTDFPIGAYFQNRFSIGDKKTLKTPLYKGEKNY
jgi:hypothetical protein